MLLPHLFCLRSQHRLFLTNTRRIGAENPKRTATTASTAKEERSDKAEEEEKGAVVVYKEKLSTLYRGLSGVLVGQAGAGMAATTWMNMSPESVGLAGQSALAHMAVSGVV